MLQKEGGRTATSSDLPLQSASEAVTLTYVMFLLDQLINYIYTNSKSEHLKIHQHY